jgi:tetratricopeptide (TPR) repeat protein
LNDADPSPDIGEARRLTGEGDEVAAQRAWLAVLRADPTSLEGLLEIARLALRGGFRSAARTAYEQAIFCHPGDATARVNLGNLLLETGELEAAQAQFAAAVNAAPALAAAHQGLARALTALGNPIGAQPHWRAGFAAGAAMPQPYRGGGTGVRLLLLVSTAGGNIPTRALLDDRVFAVTALYPEHHDRAAPVPAHDLIFNAIGDADLCGAALEAAEQIVAASTKPVLNPPAAVARTGRAEIARRLAGQKDAVVPAIRAIGRAQLLEAPDLGFPILVRAAGFNTGQHFLRVEHPADLAAAVAELPGDDLLAIEPLDARSQDGRFRKYRVMSIGGRLYPIHLAVSGHWKVHYFSADMAALPQARAEEQAFLDDMAGVLGPRAMAALTALFAELGLDYAGADFALAPDGRLMLFEANAGMVIAPPGPEPMWDYRRAAIGAALEAVRAMLLASAART